MNLDKDVIIKVAEWWKENNGLMHIELAALEPLLWNNESLKVDFLVKSLKDMGFYVSMTSNGVGLHLFSDVLKKSGLDLLRLSWHSMNRDVYKDITGGGSLEKFMLGIHSAINNNINISINRVLLKGYTDDLIEQIKFIDDNKLRLKLLDLYWTKNSSNLYDQFYISPEEVINKIDYNLLNKENFLPDGKRERVRFLTKNGGVIEYKIKSSANVNNKVCDSCSLKENCLEGYADYFRVFPDSLVSLCYQRNDLKFNILNKNNVFVNEDNIDLMTYMKSIPLRFVLTGQCNFNCGFPKTTTSWCLKQGHNFKFPKRVLRNDK